MRTRRTASGTSTRSPGRPRRKGSSCRPRRIRPAPRRSPGAGGSREETPGRTKSIAAEPIIERDWRVSKEPPNEALRDLAALVGDEATREIVQLFLRDFPES